MVSFQKLIFSDLHLQHCSRLKQRNDWPIESISSVKLQHWSIIIGKVYVFHQFVTIDTEEK